MKKTFILLLIITLCGCGTTPNKTEESPPSFILTNNFRYNQPIASYQTKFGILKDSIGISYKTLPIKNKEGKDITCKYHLVGGYSCEVDSSCNDFQDALIRRIDCSFGVLDTVNGYAWKSEALNGKEILSLLSLSKDFKVIDEWLTYAPNSVISEIATTKRSMVKLLLEKNELKHKYKSGYEGSDEEMEYFEEISIEDGNTYAISSNDKVIAVVHLRETWSETPLCTGITYKSYKDWIHEMKLKISAITTGNYQMKKQYGL